MLAIVSGTEMTQYCNNSTVSEGAQTCLLPLFRDLDVDSMTLKLGVLDILNMYSHTENEAASLRHSKLKAQI